MTTFTFIGLADSYFGMILDCDITSAVCCYLQVFHGDLCCFVATSIRHNLCFFGANIFGQICIGAIQIASPSLVTENRREAEFCVFSVGKFYICISGRSWDRS